MKSIMPPINLIHLRYFYDSVRLKSLSQAARENYVSQSTISQGIFKLEIALQATLSTHSRQAFRLTEEGEAVFKEAIKIFNAVDNLHEKLSCMKGVVSGKVEFACTNAIALHFLTDPYLKMRNEYPEVSLKFHRGNLLFIHDSLNQQKCSFALALEALTFDAYEKEVIKEGAFRFYQTKGNQKRGILVDHLENLEVKQIQNSYLKKYKIPLPVDDTFSSWSMVLTFVCKGCGIGLLPDFMRGDMEEVHFDIPLPTYKICAYKLKDTVLTTAAKALIKVLKEV